MAEWDKFLSSSQLEMNSEEVVKAARDVDLKMRAAYDKMSAPKDHSQLRAQPQDHNLTRVVRGAILCDTALEFVEAAVAIFAH